MATAKKTVKVGKSQRSAPTTRTPALEQDLFDLLRDGHTVTGACKELGVHRVTVWKWCEEDAEFEQRFMRARVAGADSIAEDAITIVETTPKTDAMGRVDSAYVRWQQLRFDARFKILSKLHPAKYGDKIEQTLQGPGGDGIKIESTVTFVDAPARDDEPEADE